MDFREFLKESEDLLQQIYDNLAELSDEELDEFGDYLFDEFFEGQDEDGAELNVREDEYDVDDIKVMISALGSYMYQEVLDFLVPEFDELDEGVSRIMKKSNVNRKKRKFMKNSKADMRKTKSARKKDARLNKTKRKRNYRANKVKIKAYQKSRNDNIKKGTHKVKKRRAS